LNLPKGSEVVTAACTFSTTLAPIIQCGLKPVFCDVEIGRYVPSVDQVMSVVTPNTLLILLPNLIGSKPDWTELRKRTDVLLFEDSADTMTCTPETDISITSFYASHIITAGGTGGMLMMNDENILKKATMYRDWGRIGDNSEEVSARFEHSVDGIPYDYKFLYGVIGYNMKSSEMNAAFGLVQLARIEEIKEKRRAIFQRYIENLQDLPELRLPDNWKQQDWLAFPIMFSNRMGILRYLEEHNIQTRVCFAGNVTRHPAYREYLQVFPAADKIMEEGFLIGAHHGMTMDDVDYVCSIIRQYLQSFPERIHREVKTVPGLPEDGL
jgi:CDP-6-deoxy-D-xylo-4-hexulose-3-dehydrase